jgi:hypothetical protein
VLYSYHQVCEAIVESCFFKMNIFTHMMLSKNIRDNTYRQIGAKINLPGFMFGNILPDILHIYKSERHFLKDSLDYICANSLEILNRPSGFPPYYSYEYSKKIGVITHYISDYFCYAHSPKYKKSMFRHFVYEFIMMFNYKKGVDIYKRDFEIFFEFINFSDMESYIKQSNEIYEFEDSSSVTDVAYAIYASTVVLTSLLKEELSNDVNLADDYCIEFN